MKVLVIAPHMDDEVLGAGGTIVKHIEHGDLVTVCIVANRAYDHRYVDSDTRKEQEKAHLAQQILGYHHLCFLNLPDEQLDQRLIDVIVPLERAYMEVGPDIVYTCHRGDPHQDHQAVFKATMVLSRSIGQHRLRRVLCYEVPSATDQAVPFPDVQFIPNLYVGLSASQLQKKIDGMKCYDRESRAFPHPRSEEGIVVFARKRGIEVALEAAEAFVMIRDIWE